MTENKTIQEFIINKENEMNRDVDINGWPWNFKNHIKTSFFYKHGRLLNGNDENTPVMNITRPLLNLQYRAEDIDVKDIFIYVDDPGEQHLSFLVKKYHDDVFIQENDIDTFIDDIKETKIDYGVGIAKKLKSARPDVVPLQSIAFCDQTNLLSGPIGFLHNLAPDELLEMEAYGWGDEANGATCSLEDLIVLAEEAKEQAQNEGQPNKTPGKYIQVYEVHGMLPKAYLDDSSDYRKYKYQLQIVGMYQDKDRQRKGVILFRKEQKKGNLKVVLRDKVTDRCAGFGGAEELFEPQVWTTYDQIRMKDLLDATSKIIIKTTDPTIKAKHPTGLKDVDNLEFIELTEGTDATQLDTTPRSMALFEKSVNSWFEYAQRMSGASEALLGQTPPSGTPFKLQDLIVQQGQSLHNYRRGKFAKFIEEIYKDWIIPYIQDEIVKGTRFLSTLSGDEMEYVLNCVIRKEVGDRDVELVLSGKLPMTPEEKQAYTQQVRDEFMRGGNKKFIEILKGEFKKKPLRVKINVAGKQKDFAGMVDKIVNIFRQIISNPQGFMQIMQIPDMAKNFNQILEFSGLSAANFSGLQYQSIPSPMSGDLQASTPRLEGSVLANNKEA